ncbi:MAG TPA: amidohydrolase family protein, partial [Gaiellales bacterium]|nr:amidohydrolase family protein [Gaiellales bacterium]
DGTIDCIATDHAPHADHEKDAPFEEAPFGVIGLETAFAAVYTHLVEPGMLPLQTVIERMSSGPALAFGLPAPGLARGRVADIAVWDLGASRVIEPPYASRSRNCAFAGRSLRGVCRLTISGGRVAHRLIEAVA